MKNIILLFLLFTMLACSESFLDVTPKTYQSAGIFFKTKDQFIQAVNGAYAPLQGLHTGSMWALSEMRSDNTSYQYNTGDRSGFPNEEIDEFRENNNNNSNVNGFFSGSYSGISRCNVILDRIQVAEIDAATKDQVTGEASFLRAFYYLNMIRQYGNVPSVFHEVTSTDEAFAISNPVAPSEIYPLIIADVQSAIQKLPEAYTAATDKGRVTKGTARMLLAKIYLTQKNFAEAAKELQAIVQSGKYQLNASYADNFNIAKENGPESLFEIQYIEGPNGESSNFIYTFAPWNSGTKVASLGVASGAAAGWNVPTQDLLDAYEAGDLRKDISIGFDFTDPSTQKVVPYVKKYQSAHTIRFQTASNFPVYRYADVLLSLAECLNEGGFSATGDAVNYVNLVRKRAGLANLGAAQTASQDALRQAIAQERRVELAFENHRWYDLVRTGKAQEVMAAHAVREKAAKPHVVAAAYQSINLTLPYPLREQLLIPK